MEPSQRSANGQKINVFGAGLGSGGGELEAPGSFGQIGAPSETQASVKRTIVFGLREKPPLREQSRFEARTDMPLRRIVFAGSGRSEGVEAQEAIGTVEAVEADGVIVDRSPGEQIDLQPIEARAAEPEAYAAEPETRATEPEARATEPEARATEPEARATEPEAYAAEPEAPAAEPEAPAAQSEPEPEPEPPLPNPLDAPPTEDLLYLLDSKVQEFILLGYGQVTRPDLWEYFKRLRRNRPSNLHELVNGILCLQPQAFMNFTLQQAYRAPAISMEDFRVEELFSQ